MLWASMIINFTGTYNLSWAQKILPPAEGTRGGLLHIIQAQIPLKNLCKYKTW